MTEKMKWAIVTGAIYIMLYAGMVFLLVALPLRR